MASNNQDESAKTIGNRSTDLHYSDTLYGYLLAWYKHVHMPQWVYPFLDDGVTLTADNTAYTLGAKVEIIPANTITKWFDIHWVIIEEVSANDRYCIELYSGEIGSEVLIAQLKAIKNTTAGSGVISIPVQIPKQEANTRISGAAASKSGGGDEITISLAGHEY